MGAFSVSTRGNSFNHFFLLLQCVCATVFLSVTEAGYPCTDCNDPANCWIVPDDSGNVNIDSSVTSIPDNAWKNCGLLQSISFSNAGTLRSMGEYTFAYSHLKGAVVLPDSLESIGIHSFDTVNIESINIPPLLTIINDDMFTSNMMLTTVTFESHGSLAEIGTNAFYSCVALNDVVLPDNGLLTYIGEAAFSGCKALPRMVVPESVESMGSEVFRTCTSLASLQLPSALTEIPDFMANDCSSLTDVTIPDTVRSIGKGAFNSASSISDLTVPSSVVSIGSSAFQFCHSITSLYLPDSVTTVGSSAFAGMYSMATLRISNSMTAIVDSLFAQNAVTDLQIPASVTEIARQGFYLSIELQNLNIPDTVVSVGDSAFENCPKLETVTVGAGVRQLSSIGTTFNNCPKLTTVYVNSLDITIDNSLDPATLYGALGTDESTWPTLSVYYKSGAYFLRNLADKIDNADTAGYDSGVYCERFTNSSSVEPCGCKLGYGSASNTPDPDGYFTCELCPLSTYSADNSTQSPCEQCPEGLVTCYEGATSRDQCLNLQGGNCSSVLPPTPFPTGNPAPTSRPSGAPVPMITPSPTFRPVASPTSRPTAVPTSAPTKDGHTPAPTQETETVQPTSAPTKDGRTPAPTSRPTAVPTSAPTKDGHTPAPTQETETVQPTSAPTKDGHTPAPTSRPTAVPTSAPTKDGHTPAPTQETETVQPTSAPTKDGHTPVPTSRPTAKPSFRAPTAEPTKGSMVCPAGQRHVLNDPSQCEDCPVDSYSLSGADKCQQCSSGTSTNGNTGQSECTKDSGDGGAGTSSKGAATPGGVAAGAAVGAIAAVLLLSAAYFYMSTGMTPTPTNIGAKYAQWNNGSPSSTGTDGDGIAPPVPTTAVPADVSSQAVDVGVDGVVETPLQQGPGITSVKSTAPAPAPAVPHSIPAAEAPAPTVDAIPQATPSTVNALNDAL